MLRRTMLAAALGIVLSMVVGPAMGQQAPPATSRWPVQVTTDQGATITIFQPQLENFQGDQLSGRAAVSVQSPGQTEPTFGAIWITSRVSIDRVARTVQILDVNITQQRFPDAAPADQTALADAVKQVFVGHGTSLSLDQLLSMLEVVQKKEAAAGQFQFDPPKIVFLDHSAVKLQYDGAPRFVQADNSNLLRAINTPFFVALDPSSKTYYLKGGGLWFSATDPMGPFQGVGQPPAPVAALADSSGYKDPQQPLSTEQAMSIQIVTATDPTELVWTDGPAQMSPIAGTNLLYVTNTDSDVFLQIGSQRIYLLLSGRWYTAPTEAGPWAYVPPSQLPADFSRIPPDSDKANVLADVPGTQAAQDAVADTYLPQTAAVDLHKFDQPPVAYDGEADFESVQGTDMRYAVNTDATVFLVAGRYYCCYQAVWYVSDSPNGPWQICTAVPPEIYTVPPSCPDYPAKYCYVYGYTPDVVYCGYLPGYVGCYVYDGCVLYGTGWHYRPWLRRHYYSRPWTYGFAPRYNWYAGHWGFDFALSFGGGRGWIGRAPGGWVHSGGVWFGFGGFRPVYAHDALHDTAAQRELAVDAARRDAYSRNVYDYRKDLHPEPGVRAAHPPERAEARPGPEVKAPERAAAAPRNDVFADRAGNVYRRTDQGWEVRNQNQWHAAPAESRAPEPARTERPEPAPAPPVNRAPEEPARAAPNYGELNGDYRARVEGDQRAQVNQAPRERESGGGGSSGGGGGRRK